MARIRQIKFYVKHYVIHKQPHIFLFSIDNNKKYITFRIQEVFID